MHPNHCRATWPAALFSIVCFLFSLLPGPVTRGSLAAASEKTISIDADQQFAYAEQSYQDKAYEQAIYEYNRFIYFFHDDPRVENARFGIGMCYFHLNRFQKAATAFQDLINIYEDTQIAVDAYFQMSRSYLKLRIPGQALLSLRNLITVSKKQRVRDEAYYKMGWTYIDMADWRKARWSFDQIHPQNHEHYQLETIRVELDKQELRPKKNPDLAGVFSVFPGAGYLYTRRYQDALVAFLLNGVIAVAAYESFENDNEALGGLLCMVGIGFYGGSIFGSIASAHKYNHGQTRQFVKKLKQKFKIGVIGSPRGRRIALSIRYSF